MNFFQRRKILKGVNYLELTPLHRYESEVDDENNVAIHVPRFEHKLLMRLFVSRNKTPFVRFHLDELGSKVWLSINGKDSVAKIVENVRAKLNGEFDEGEQRVSRFLTQLYINKMISFQEIEGQ
ncbi:MAG: PqqD family protein [Ignavibacteria bacterium]|nr:PqqD family protein [Ignavibacteria bacterium]